MKTIFIILFLLFPLSLIPQTQWIKYNSNPIITGTNLAWDANYASFSSVIKDSIFKMWYSGGLQFGFFNNTQIGYATSEDGISWIKHPDPVFSKGEAGKFDEGMVACVSVIVDEGIYKMWYIGTHGGEAENWRIGYATSPDGMNWTRQNNGNPVLDLGSAGEWDDKYIGHPAVVRDGDLLKMWYHGTRELGNGGNIGYAYSIDGINWTKHDDPGTTDHPYAESDPVFTGSGEAWDMLNQQHPTVIKNGDSFEMWYSGFGNDLNFPGQNFGYAGSTDGLNWIVSLSTPVLVIGTGGINTFDRSSLLAPHVMFDGTHYRMWYTGRGTRDNRWRIGLAGSHLDILPVELENFSAAPKGSSIDLNWTTTTEINNHGFEIFRNGFRIAFMEGNGTTTEKHDYFFSDKNLHSSIYNYRLEQIDLDGTRSILSEVTVSLVIPETFGLEQNYPNPFNPSTTISWQSPISSHQTLKIYDLLGNEIATLVDEYREAGNYEFEFDASSLSSGTYFYRLQAGEFSAAKKIILLK